MSHVKELDIGVVPEAAVSGAKLVHSEQEDPTLTFNAKKLDPRGEYLDAGKAVVTFKRCICTKFGYPNDEALGGHPLFVSGLRHYGIFEVLDSSWIAEVNSQNKKKFPAFEYEGLRHFIFTFHDSTFECLADDLVVEIVK